MVKINRVGQIFTRLLVISEAPSDIRSDGKGTFTRWLCRCACGNEVVVRTNGLVSGTTGSCGCLKLLTPQYQPKLPPTEGGFLRVFSAYKAGAARRKRSFTLTTEDFRKLTSQHCHYCGTEPRTLSSTGNKYSNYVYNGIDRKDNALGYVLENCLPCCEICNKAKGTKTYTEFIEWIQRVTLFQKTREQGFIVPQTNE